MKILPAIDIIDGRCVRLTQGDYARRSIYDTSPAEMVRRYLDHGLDRIHAVDLDGAKSRAPRNLGTLRTIAAIDGAVIEWSGGITCDRDLEAVLAAGARAVSIGSLAVREPEVFAGWLQRYNTEHGGSDPIMLGADLRYGKVAVAGWQEDSTLSGEQLIARFIPYGLREVIVTDISRDGMLQGPSFDLYRRLASVFPGVIFTISGGISCADDLRRLADMGFTRAIVGKAVYEGRITLEELQQLNDDAC